MQKLTQDNVSLEAQVEICDVATVATNQHIDIGTRDSIDDFLLSDALNLLHPLLAYHFVVESVSSCFPSVSLLDREDDEIKLLLAHFSL